MTIYITDTTVRPPKDVTFNDFPSAVRHLEGMCQRGIGQSRKNHMLLLESVGHGEDDWGSVNFVRAMAERYEIGVIRDGRKMRCDITSAFAFNKPEYGS
jgi:hypothetical protein